MSAEARFDGGQGKMTTGALRIALAGNPNCGKTTVFNAYTGARQHVGTPMNAAAVNTILRWGRSALKPCCSVCSC